MKADNRTIRISVRSLVEFLLRRGSIESRTGPSSEAAMLEGARIHRALQKEAGEGYRAEVALRMEIPLEEAGPGAVLCLEGRADGIFTMEESAGEDLPAGLQVIDEIKTVFGSVRSLSAPEEVHLAQARCYALMYARREGLDKVGIRMTYCSQVTRRVRYFYEEQTLQALEIWFRDLLDWYMPWAGLRLSFMEERQETIRRMEFPFPYRKGQYELAGGVYRTIARGRKLFLQAPTGTGKTMAVLFPALKTMGEGKSDRIWYLTAKAVTGRAALEALRVLREQGLRLRSVVLASKERVCPCETVDCRAAACERADGHFDRINEALWNLLTDASDGRAMTTERIAACAEKYRVCPYELAMDAAEMADVIIGDYNYAFHPQARLDRFLDGGKPVFLVDEAHNLLERGREMYSAELSRSQVHSFRRSVKETRPRLWKRMADLERVLRDLDRRLASSEENGDPQAARPALRLSALREVHVLREWQEDRDRLLAAVETVRDEIRRILEQEDRSAVLDGEKTEADSLPEPDRSVSTAEPEHSVSLPESERSVSLPEPDENKDTEELRGDSRQGLLDFLFMISGFQQVLEKLDDHYIVYATGKGAPGSGSRKKAEPAADSAGTDRFRRGRKGGFTLHLYCADPSGRLRECMEKTVSAVFFSATFLPIQYYKGLLSGTPEDYEMYARSSFSPDQQAVVIAGDVTSRYRNRNEGNFRRIAERIGMIAGCQPGNYMAFFPSYAFMDSVLEAFRQICGESGGCQDENLVFDHSGFSHLPIRLVAQSRRMGEEEKAAFLNAFEEVSSDRHLIGFCVLGGMFGEGIDLRDDRLIGSIIVGTGIPPVEPQRELLRAYFSDQGKNGYDYAYRFPGMNKVLQAAGRVIRTEQDRGIVALLDDRFAEPANRELYPAEWDRPSAEDGPGAVERIRRFWNGRNE